MERLRKCCIKCGSLNIARHKKKHTYQCQLCKTEFPIPVEKIVTVFDSGILFREKKKELKEKHIQ